jgi:hypothetical protein
MHVMQRSSGQKSPRDLRAVAPLVESMNMVWKDTRPPVSQIAHCMVYGYTFMSLRRLDPIFPQNLSGKKLVDLGAGDPCAMIDFARRCGVSEYVAVDRYAHYPARLGRGRGIELVNDDMLMHLLTMDDESANIAMLAIDSIVLGNPDMRTELRYIDLLLREVARVVPISGVVLGANSEIMERLVKYGFVKVDGIEKEEGSGIFWRLQ